MTTQSVGGNDMKLTLYYAPTTCALVPWVNLTEAGAEFETVALNFHKAQHMSPEYMAINPKHKVPMLIVDGVKLTENVAIQQWIARAFPAAKLLPEAPMDELQAVSLMGWFGSGIHPFLARINNPAKVCDVTGTGEAVRRAAVEALREQFALADKMLAGRDYFLDRFTAVDPYFFWCFRRATQFDLPLADFANCQAHFARLGQRPSVQKVLAFEKETLARFAG